MVKEFLDFIRSEKLCDRNDKILVTVSGGVDSVVLASLFRQAGFNFAIAHCNFHLRGEESNADEAFVKELARSFEVECFAQSFNPENYSQQHNVSIQMAARDLRYTWFRALAKKYNFSAIATAHHLDDSLETALYNMARGTGIAGLRGILPSGRGIIRPLLFMTKEQIRNYAHLTGLSWREDSSNASVKYHRNRMRHEIIPVLKKINPAVVTTFSHTMKRLAETEDILKQQAKKLMEKHSTEQGPDVYLSRKIFQETNTVLIEEILKRFGFNFVQAQELAEAVNIPTTIGKRFLSAEYQLNIDRQSIIISPLGDEISEVSIGAGDRSIANGVVDLTVKITGQTGELFRPARGASLDLERLKFPLKLRKWAMGDRFQPLGMKGKKKLSDFMIDEKIPLNLKERVCVLESDHEIVWVVGYRIDDRFKVQKDTRKIYHIFLSDHDQSL